MQRARGTLTAAQLTPVHKDYWALQTTSSDSRHGHLMQKARGFCRLRPNFNIGALMIRIGFWGPLYYKIIWNPQNSIGTYLGPYSTGAALLKSSNICLGACQQARPSSDGGREPELLGSYGLDS